MSMPTSRMFLTAAAVAATIGTFLACTSAHADVRVNGNDETATTTVHFADLDVTSHDGAQHLFLRLKNAAVSVTSMNTMSACVPQRTVIEPPRG